MPIKINGFAFPAQVLCSSVFFPYFLGSPHTTTPPPLPLFSGLALTKPKGIYLLQMKTI